MNCLPLELVSSTTANYQNERKFSVSTLQLAEIHVTLWIKHWSDEKRRWMTLELARLREGYVEVVAAFGQSCREMARVGDSIFD